MILFPNCKINIGLRVLQRRPDGYHNIESVMVPVGWTDILEIVPAKGSESTLSLTGNKVECAPEKNLVMKAYRAVCSEFPTLPPVDIYLRKNIPDGAGLGGGSSDAAFMIKGLNALFGLEMSDEKMAKIASKIGADCPFFIYNKPAEVTDTGVILNEIDFSFRNRPVLIVKPSDSVSTAEAYRGVTPSVPEAPALRDLVRLQPTEWKIVIKNDFENSVGSRVDDIFKIKEQLYQSGAEYAAMTGSGSAVFGLFENEETAQSAAKLFDGMFIVKVTKIL